MFITFLNKKWTLHDYETDEQCIIDPGRYEFEELQERNVILWVLKGTKKGKTKKFFLDCANNPIDNQWKIKIEK